MALINPVVSQGVILGFSSRPGTNHFLRVALDGWEPGQSVGPPIALEGTVLLRDPPSPSEFTYRADMRYPPVTLKPGESLSSGVLLVIVTDVPDRGLEEWDRLADRLTAAATP